MRSRLLRMGAPCSPEATSERAERTAMRRTVGFSSKRRGRRAEAASA
jgi:hypothetical protein